MTESFVHLYLNRRDAVSVLVSTARMLVITAVLQASPLITGEAPAKTPAEMLRESGYPSEVYAIPTEDGYVIRLDRIPNPGKPAVFVSNPLYAAGSIYLLMGSNYSIGYALHRAGFDVFLGSDRGTVYSQDFALEYNAKVSPKTDKYFLFSYDEHAVYDNPAFIRKILEVTGQSQIFYIGYSMGSSEFFAMVSELPEMNKIIRSAHLMAPVLALGYKYSTLYELFHTTHNFITAVLDLIHFHKLPDDTIRTLFQALCTSWHTPCDEIFYFLYNSKRKVDYLGTCPDFLVTIPTGGSLREILHYAQNTRYPDRFKPYDYGKKTNLVKYGSIHPPDYELLNIKVPLHLYRGNGDVLVTDENIEYIRTRVPGYKDVWWVPVEGFGHLDFAWSHEAVTVYEKIIEDMQRYLLADTTPIALPAP